MGQTALFLTFLRTVCWLVLFEPLRYVSGIRTAPALFCRMNCSLAIRTRCKCFRCQRLCFLEPRVISLFLFPFYPFTTLSNDVAKFFTVMAYDFGLFGVSCVILWKNSCKRWVLIVPHRSPIH